jgi:hypothetical protein
MNVTAADLLPDKQSQITERHSRHLSETYFDSILRRATSVAALLGVFVCALVFFGFLAHHLFSNTTADGWLVKVIEAHFAATIAVPLSAVSAICVVLTLKATSGPIEFEALGLKFQGASGPLVFWLFIFGGFIAAVRVLWPILCK